MPHVPGLRSPYARVGRLVYFGRMLDKIRLHAAGRLPADYVVNLGAPRPVVFDARCCRFLGIAYEDLVARTLAGGSDTEILAWAEARGTPRDDEECMIWNRFMTKLGWRDDRTELLRQRCAEFGLTHLPIDCFFDVLDYDEGRDPVRSKAWLLRDPLVIVLMGVAGSGKSTVGAALGEALGWSFRDADEFHSPANIAKMAAGQPLDDQDRAPWLEAIRDHIRTTLRRGESGVVTCSSLKQRYRTTLMTDLPGTRLVYLKGERDVLWKRISERSGHFMKPEMLDSQLAALEEPTDALTLEITRSPVELVQQIRSAFDL